MIAPPELRAFAPLLRSARNDRWAIRHLLLGPGFAAATDGNRIWRLNCNFPFCSGLSLWALDKSSTLTLVSDSPTIEPYGGAFLFEAKPYPLRYPTIHLPSSLNLPATDKKAKVKRFSALWLSQQLQWHKRLGDADVRIEMRPDRILTSGQSTTAVLLGIT